MLRKAKVKVQGMYASFELLAVWFFFFFLTMREIGNVEYLNFTLRLHEIYHGTPAHWWVLGTLSCITWSLHPWSKLLVEIFIYLFLLYSISWGLVVWYCFVYKKKLGNWNIYKSCRWLQLLVRIKSCISSSILTWTEKNQTNDQKGGDSFLIPRVSVCEKIVQFTTHHCDPYMPIYTIKDAVIVPYDIATWLLW